MKIGVVSDTHGCVETWREVYRRYFADCDFILHAGDVLYHGPRNPIPAEYNPKELAEELNACPVPVIIVAGNCDAEVDAMVLDMPVQAPYAYVFADGRRIIVHHGQSLDEAGRWALAKRLGAAVLVTGHTHVPELTKRDGVTLLNPGSPAMSKRLDGHGTVARITAGKIEIIDIVTGEVFAHEEL
ncbi:phosphodiesterase [Anaeroselena agilis]|uniref:Phosphoesterase n=1 Tax=Anaeroselena agilis TaxID=3063788 RepID=A0ABU3NXG6_9FIRM|nr:phosphodiesterase [Selenomonadales bacterium 4137-cl]